MRRRSKAWAGAVAISLRKNGIDQLPRPNGHLHHLDVRPRIWDVRNPGPCSAVARHRSHLGRADYRVEMVDGPLRIRPGRVGVAIVNPLAYSADEIKGLNMIITGCSARSSDLLVPSNQNLDGNRISYLLLTQDIRTGCCCTCPLAIALQRTPMSRKSRDHCFAQRFQSTHNKSWAA